MDSDKWLLFPICQSKTRIMLREDTILENFPLFCPKCKQETLIHVKQMNTTVIREPAAQYQHLLDFVPDFKKVHTVIWSFKKIVMEQRQEELEKWIADAERLGIEEIQSFINGRRRDIDGVRNAIKYKNSNGLAEGTVNKIKVIKRIMYGRCCFETLKIKSLWLEKMRKNN